MTVRMGPSLSGQVGQLFSVADGDIVVDDCFPWNSQLGFQRKRRHTLGYFGCYCMAFFSSFPRPACQSNSTVTRPYTRAAAAAATATMTAFRPACLPACVPLSLCLPVSLAAHNFASESKSRLDWESPAKTFSQRSRGKSRRQNPHHRPTGWRPDVRLPRSSWSASARAKRGRSSSGDKKGGRAGTRTTTARSPAPAHGALVPARRTAVTQQRCRSCPRLFVVSSHTTRQHNSIDGLTFQKQTWQKEMN